MVSQGLVARNVAIIFSLPIPDAKGEAYARSATLGAWLTTAGTQEVGRSRSQSRDGSTLGRSCLPAGSSAPLGALGAEAAVLAPGTGAERFQRDANTSSAGR